MRGLRGKRAIVTGGGGGIGTATCVRLAEEGASVAVFDRDAQTAARTADAIRKSGGTAKAYAVDIGDYAAVRAGVAQCESDLGPVDILINNAGWDRIANFLDTTPDFWDQVVRINLTGPLNMHHAVLPGMAKRGSGRVVNVSSDAARVGSSGEAVYAACKGGVIALTKTLAREMAQHNITLNAVCPGPTATPLLDSITGDGESGAKIIAAMTRGIPLRRIGKPDDLCGMLAFLASDDAAFITGQVISVSGGLTMAG